MYIQISKFTCLSSGKLHTYRYGARTEASFPHSGNYLNYLNTSILLKTLCECEWSASTLHSLMAMRVYYRWGKFKLLIKACTSPHTLNYNHGPWCGTRFLCTATFHQNTKLENLLSPISSLLLSSLTKRIMKRCNYCFFKCQWQESSGKIMGL